MATATEPLGQAVAGRGGNGAGGRGNGATRGGGGRGNAKGKGNNGKTKTKQPVPKAAAKKPPVETEQPLTKEVIEANQKELLELSDIKRKRNLTAE